MRFASSTSCAAVSSGTLPMSLRKSWSASVEISRASGSRTTTSRPLVGLVDDLDVELLERRVELVQLDRLELVAERERDLLVREEARLLALAHERPGVLMVEDDAHFAPFPLLEIPYPVSST